LIIWGRNSTFPRKPPNIPNIDASNMALALKTFPSLGLCNVPFSWNNTARISIEANG